MVELAGEIADGLILTTVTPEHARVMLEPIHRADFDVIATVPLALDAPEAMARARESLAAYGVIDVYNRHLVRQGFETEARALREAWERRSWSDAVAAVSDHMLDALCISGDLAKCREGIERYREAGVKTLIITPVARFSESLAALKGNL